MTPNGITEYFTEVETKRKYKGYLFSVAQAITILILGSMCKLENVKQIHHWAASDKVSEFLKERFAIERIPCYYWRLRLLQLVKSESLNEFFTKWVETMLPEGMRVKVTSEIGTENKVESQRGDEPIVFTLDGKTVRSTERLESFEDPLHIVSAHLAELGLTFAQKAVDDKSNEIPAVQALLEELEIKGCLIVADALNCQKATAKIVVEKGADYLLPVKGNQRRLHNDIVNYVHNEENADNMQSAQTEEKNRGRIERRTAFVSGDITVIRDRTSWANIASFGAIYREVQKRKKGSDEWEESIEWQYYISSQALTAQELLRYARMEWSVESMHWLLDVHFTEDFCRVADKNGQKNLNILRKAALNLVKSYQIESAPKRPLSRIMFDCLLNPEHLLEIIPRGCKEGCAK